MLTFATLILGNLALIFTNRSSLPIYTKHRPWNPALLWLAGLLMVAWVELVKVLDLRMSRRDRPGKKS